MAQDLSSYRRKKLSDAEAVGYDTLNVECRETRILPQRLAGTYSREGFRTRSRASKGAAPMPYELYCVQYQVCLEA